MNTQWRTIEKSPENDQDILMWTTSGNIVVGWFTAPGQESSLNGYCKWSERMNCGCMIGGVTHWMPLPKPPGDPLAEQEA